MRSPALRSILVPTDFSEGAQAALERALQLPVGPSTKVTLLHVLPEGIPGTLRDDAIHEAERSLDKALARIARTKETPRSLVGAVVEGDPTQHILKRSRTVEADLIVMGRHGRRVFADVFVGSTAQKVMRHGEVPVLLVQTAPKAPYARPLLSLDTEKTTTTVVKRALTLLGPRVKRADVVHVARVPFEDFVVVSDHARDAFRAGFVKTSTARLAKLLKPLSAVRFNLNVLSGDARTLILSEATERRADVLVVGTHARTGLKRVLVGSVAEWLLQRAPCDVLVVR
ncbi:MAG: universal stress protein [Archangium sp.]|nr:universal stress protein [Archangium sp.]